MSTVESIICTGCGEDVDPLAIFPGKLCLTCYSHTAAATAPLTADDIVSMWGGSVRRPRRRR